MTLCAWPVVWKNAENEMVKPTVARPNELNLAVLPYETMLSNPTSLV